MRAPPQKPFHKPSRVCDEVLESAGRILAGPGV